MAAPGASAVLIQATVKRYIAAALVVLFTQLTLRADVVTDWNTAALNAIKVDRTAPPKAARALAILHAAIYDTVNGINPTHEHYLVAPQGLRTSSVDAGVAAAGRATLNVLFPAQVASFNSLYATQIGRIRDGARRRQGILWGETVAARILAVRANDGSTATASHTPGTSPGDWQPTAPAFASALLPHWGDVKPFCMRNGKQFRPAPVPKLDSAVYAIDYQLTKQFGGVDSTARSADQTAIARFWADGAGTVTPPGHWNVIARELAIARRNSVAANARLFALLNLALADAAICCWDCKYTDDFWRPITAIRAGANDGNPGTEADPNWTPLLPTPPHPDYTSGHSTFSAAGATILGLVFGDESISFTTTSEDLPGMTRSFGSLWEAAAEAGMSRIFGGIHFMSANQQGLHSGARLGHFVFEGFLRPRSALAR